MIKFVAAIFSIFITTLVSLGIVLLPSRNVELPFQREEITDKVSDKLEQKPLGDLADKNRRDISIVNLIYPTDLSDDRALVGAAHYVFIGKVDKLLGAKDRGFGPETQFSVTVIDSIKGNLVGSVILNQQGGYKDDKLVIYGDEKYESVSPEDYLIKAGQTYVFATRYSKENNWYTLIAYPTAKAVITSRADTSNDELRSLINDNARVSALRAAYPNEILLKADIANHNALNSFSESKKVSNVISE